MTIEIRVRCKGDGQKSGSERPQSGESEAKIAVSVRATPGRKASLEILRLLNAQTNGTKRRNPSHLTRSNEVVKVKQRNGPLHSKVAA